MIKKEDILKIKNSLIKSIIKTYEEMCFLDVMPIDKTDNLNNNNHIICIDVLEPMNCIITIYFTLDCKVKMAENIYGMDFKQLKTSEIDDCQLEILNVIAGNFLFNYYGTDIKYKIDLPRIIFDESEIKFTNKHKIDLFFNAEECVFKVTIDIKSL